MSRVTIHLYGLNQSITVPLKRKLTFSTRNSNLPRIENWGSSIKNRESRIETLEEIFEDLDDSFEETISFSLSKQ